MATGYWTEGKVVNGVNTGGGVFVSTPAPVSTPTVTAPVSTGGGGGSSTPAPTVTAPVSTGGGSSSYSGVSVVDYLNSLGQKSDYGSRQVLATQFGIGNYTGTAEQNTAMLSALKSGTTAAPVATPPAATTTPTYTGPSVVDYLNSTGQASDYTSRATIAAKLGIGNYTGTAEQNTAMLSALRSMAPTPPAPPTDPDPAPGLTAGSDETTKAQNDLAAIIKRYNDTITAYDSRIKDTNNSYQSMLTSFIDNQTKALDTRYQAQLKGINDQFNIAKTSQENQNARDTGTLNTNLARIGGYLGESASATGAQLKQAEDFKFAAQAFEVKRAAAIQEATDAYEDKNFKLAEAKIKEIQRIEKEARDAEQQYFENQITAQNANIQLSEFEQKNYETQIKSLALLDPATISSTTLADLDRNYFKVPGAAAQYFAIASADQKAKSEKAKFDSFKSKIDFLKSIPKGVSVPFGNESVVGLGDVGDITTFHVEDAAGNATLVTYNKGSGEVTKQDLGKIGTPSSTGGGSSPAAISDMSTALGKVAGPDGYVSPTSYKEALRTWLQAGFTTSTFENNFKIFANPAQKDKYDLTQYYNKSADDVLQLLQGLQ